MFARARVSPASAVLLCLVLVAGCGDDDGGTAAPTTTPTTAPTTTPAEPNATTVESTTTTAEPTTTVTAVIDPLAGIGEVELVDDGYGFTEGPQWIADAGVLMFVDGNTIHQVADGDEISVFRSPSNGAIGLAVDPEGRLIAAERQSRQVTRTESDGTVGPIADVFEGGRLNEPNDIAVRSDGTIYFTDPHYGAPSTAELDFHGVFRVSPDGTLTAERRGDTLEQPNGVVLSPDESRLFVSNWSADLVLVFDVAADGSLSEGSTFVTTGDAPDGMAVDNAGNLFVATGAGIEVFAPDGEPWGVIEVPETPANCAFAGADSRTLYVTARRGLYRVQMANPGHY